MPRTRRRKTPEKDPETPAEPETLCPKRPQRMTIRHGKHDRT